MNNQKCVFLQIYLQVYRSIKFYYIVESRTVWPNLWRVVNLIHILLILAHWFGCFYFLLSEVEGFQVILELSVIQSTTYFISYFSALKIPHIIDITRVVGEYQR